MSKLKFKWAYGIVGLNWDVFNLFLKIKIYKLIIIYIILIEH